MTAITLNDTELGHLSILEIVRTTSAPDHVRYGLRGWLANLVNATLDTEVFSSSVVADFFIMNGLPDFAEEFHAMRAGEAIGEAVEAGLVEPVGPDAWRWVAT